MCYIEKPRRQAGWEASSHHSVWEKKSLGLWKCLGKIISCYIVESWEKFQNIVNVYTLDLWTIRVWTAWSIYMQMFFNKYSQPFVSLVFCIHKFHQPQSKTVFSHSQQWFPNRISKILFSVCSWLSLLMGRTNYRVKSGFSTGGDGRHL